MHHYKSKQKQQKNMKVTKAEKKCGNGKNVGILSKGKNRIKFAV